MRTVCGLLMHSSLATTTDGLPLGMTAAKFWSRKKFKGTKTLVAQRLKRSGMRWRIPGGQAVLTFRALIKPGLFERALPSWTLNPDRSTTTSAQRKSCKSLPELSYRHARLTF